MVDPSGGPRSELDHVGELRRRRFGRGSLVSLGRSRSNRFYDWRADTLLRGGFIGPWSDLGQLLRVQREIPVIDLFRLTRDGLLYMRFLRESRLLGFLGLVGRPDILSNGCFGDRHGFTALDNLVAWRCLGCDHRRRGQFRSGLPGKADLACREAVQPGERGETAIDGEGGGDRNRLSLVAHKIDRFCLWFEAGFLGVGRNVRFRASSKFLVILWQCFAVFLRQGGVRGRFLPSGDRVFQGIVVFGRECRAQGRDLSPDGRFEVRPRPLLIGWGDAGFRQCGVGRRPPGRRRLGFRNAIAGANDAIGCPGCDDAVAEHEGLAPWRLTCRIEMGVGPGLCDGAAKGNARVALRRAVHFALDRARERAKRRMAIWVHGR